MLTQLKNETNVAYTENGATAYATTLSSLLDFFAQAGALRNRHESEVIKMFTRAFGDDSLLATKMWFYFRDVREGQGERKTFKTILKYLANNHSSVVEKNMMLIPFFGRWDDLYELVGTKLEAKAFELIKQQFEQDIKDEHPSLMGKWLKSENASSWKTKELATKTRKALGLSSRDYRKALTALRERINIVESLMSSKQWSEIEYDKIPSQAGLRYRKAFGRNDGERYAEFLASLERGESKINAKALFPYEIIRKVEEDYYNNDKALDLMWENLPNYFGDNSENSICVVDVSGSMTGLPMQVAVSLGLYTAERNHGKFHNHFITFSSHPQLIEVKGSTLSEKVRNMEQADWGGNTDIKAVFNLILNTAKKYNVPQEEMVEKIYIISDMEFDYCATGGNNEKLFETIRKEYMEAGYTMPKLVFWNVDARNAQFPMAMTSTGVQLVSGCSPSIFTNLLKGLDAYDLMIDVLNSERYSQVTV